MHAAYRTPVTARGTRSCIFGIRYEKRKSRFLVWTERTLLAIGVIGVGALGEFECDSQRSAQNWDSWKFNQGTARTIAKRDRIPRRKAAPGYRRVCQLDGLYHPARKNQTHLQPPVPASAPLPDDALIGRISIPRLHLHNYSSRRNRERYSGAGGRTHAWNCDSRAEGERRRCGPSRHSIQRTRRCSRWRPDPVRNSARPLRVSGELYGSGLSPGCRCC